MLVCNEMTPHRQNLQYLSCKKRLWVVMEMNTL